MEAMRVRWACFLAIQPHQNYMYKAPRHRCPPLYHHPGTPCSRPVLLFSSKGKMPMTTKARGWKWLQPRTNGWLRRSGDYLLFQASRGQRWRQGSGFPQHQDKGQAPALTRHGAGTQLRLCVTVMCDTETQPPFLDALLFSPLPLPYPSQRDRQPRRRRGKRGRWATPESKGPRWCQDPRLADSLFGALPLLSFVQAAWLPDL